jgi:hypothetical protein
MASTPEGRALTEAHRRQQLAIAARAAAASSLLWGRLDPDRLDATTPAWLARNLQVLQREHAASVKLAQAYVPSYRTAELGSSAGRVIAPVFNRAAMSEALVVAGPVRVKLLTRGGMTASGAHGASLNKFTGIMRRQVLSGGRMLIDQTTGADRQAVGWRRVSDGNPCTFCAMLCARGPVYRAASRAGTDAGGGLLDNKSGLRFHGHCGCTAEIIYGEWTPSESEQRYIDEYEKAAKQADAAGEARTEKTVLYRMRDNGVFRDSPLSRNTKTA